MEIVSETNVLSKGKTTQGTIMKPIASQPVHIQFCENAPKALDAIVLLAMVRCFIMMLHKVLLDIADV